MNLTEALVEIESLRETNQYSEALTRCLAALDADPSRAVTRLLMARVAYEAGWTAFAVEQMERLVAEQPKVAVLKRLLEELAPDSPVLQGGGIRPAEVTQEEEATVSETDFEIDDLELLEDED